MKSEEIKSYISLLSVMVTRDIKSQYDNAWLGLIWVIINPILQMVIIGFVVSMFASIEDYNLFILTGLMVWNFFSTAISKSSTSFVNSRSLLHKIQFPKSVIPFSIVISKFIQMLVALSIITSYLWFIGKFTIVGLPLLFLVLTWMLMLTMSISLMVSSLHVKYRDVEFIIRNTIRLWFYATPVLYGLSMVPKNLLFIYLLNPLAVIFELLHTSLLSLTGMINFQVVSISLMSASVCMLISVIVYFRNRDYFVDWT